MSTPAVLYHRTSHVFGLVEQADLLTAGRGRVLLVEDPLEVLAVHLTGNIGPAPTGTLLTGDHVRQVIAITGPDRHLHVADDLHRAGPAVTTAAAGLLIGYHTRNDCPASVAPGPGGAGAGEAPRGSRRTPHQRT